MLKSKNIFLRTLQSNDVDLILKWENNPKNWKVSGTKKSFTKDEIEGLVNGFHNIKANQQIRYVICLNQSKTPIGTIDLFDYDTMRNEVGVGVLIAEEDNKCRGYATEALELVVGYCRNELNAVNLFCNITKDNAVSIRLFEKCEFQFIEKRMLFDDEVNYYELRL